MLIKQKLMIGSLFIALSQLVAAQTYSPPVSIILAGDGSGSAEGSLGGTHNSSNNVEYITCIVDRELSGSVQNTYVNCMARSSSGQTVSCTSTDDDIADGLGGASTDAILGFQFDTAGNCTQTLVYKSSSLSPKL